jgi:hypothetical protein
VADYISRIPHWVLCRMCQGLPGDIRGQYVSYLADTTIITLSVQLSGWTQYTMYIYFNLAIEFNIFFGIA